MSSKIFLENPNLSSNEINIEHGHVISNNVAFRQVKVQKKPVQPPFKLRNLKRGSIGSLTVIAYLRDQQRL